MPTEPLDLVGLLIALLAFIASKEVAYTVGPYAAIVLLACAGSALALSAEEQTFSPYRALWFVMVRVILAVTITIAFAEVLRDIVPWLKPRYTLSPIAFGIGWIKDYDSVRSWFGRMIDLFTTKRINDGK
jgi:ABC-type polysaccharide/polyol phosphate export permease